MFTVEMKINGSMIVHVYGYNTGHLDPEGGTIYEWELYEVPLRQINKGTLSHYRHEGLVTLINKILSDHIKTKGD